MAAAESNLIKNGYADSSIDLSEQQMMYFMNRPYTDPLGNYTPEISWPGLSVRDFINVGGNAAEAVSFMSRWTEPVLESEAPLNMGMCEIDQGNGTSHRDYNLLNNITVDESLATKSYWHMDSAKFCNYDTAHIQNVKELISTYGGVTIGIYNYNRRSIGQYPMDETLYNDTGRTPNHCVEVVGWDDDYPKENFLTTPGDDGAWLIKNSGGRAWQQGIGYKTTGFIWVSYYDKSLSGVAAIDFTDKDTHENMYCSNGWNSYADGGEYPDTSADGIDYDKREINVFTAKAYCGGEVEKVDAVMIKLPANTGYEITVYVNPEIRNGVITGYSGKSSTIRGRTDYHGYYTVELDESAYVKEGDTFAVVLRGGTTHVVRGLTNKAENYRFSESLTVDRTNVSLRTGETAVVKATVLPETATNPTAGFYTSNPEVAMVDENGKITAMGEGGCTVTAKSYDGRNSSQVSVMVTKPAATGTSGSPSAGGSQQEQASVGTTFKNRGITYMVTGRDTVRVTDIRDEKSITIPATIYHDRVYKVTEIGRNVAKGNKKLEKVTIGANVTKIGNKAFQNCPKLGKVTIKSKVLKKVGSGAFKKIKGGAVIKVPKAKLKDYQKLIGKRTDSGVGIK